MLRKKAIAVSYLVGVFMLCLSFPCPARSDSRKPVYLDASKPVEERVEDLLARMTLEEKVGQLNMPCVYVHQLGKDIKTKMAACIEFARGTRIKGIGPGGGFFTLPNTILQEGTEQQATFLNRLQKIAREETRLGIPLLITEEGTHGLMCSGGTIFPEGPALGSTWNMRLLQKIYTVAAREARAIGVHQLFTLVVEPNRDPRLGRNQEGYSEDPYLCSRIAEVIVRAVQGDDIGQPDKVVAGLCHYPGQSQPVSGLERGAMEWSERILREAFLPPWEAGIRQAGALGVMATYPAINGVPVHASSAILRDLLRDELEFQGIVLGEGGGLSTLINEGLAPSQKIAGEMTIKAGVDVGISYEEAYLLPLIENVQEGKVSMDFIDRALRRVLRIKFRLGLFEKPYVDVVRAKRVVHTKESRDLALEAAHEGIVLLKNQNHLLPLDKNLKKVAVIGPNADNVLNQLGDYTSNKILQDVVTVLDGIRDKVSTASDVVHIKGCNVFNRDLNEIDRARQAAKEADVAVVVLGENAWKTKGDQITSGEGYDVASLDLTGLQEDLLKAVEATGTPTVLILINGRPLSIAWAAENVDAIVETWLSGEMGGAAIADVLFGDVNPSGRLPITIPRHVGQLPVYYNHKKSKTYWIEKGWGKPYADMSPEPLYAFGHGLSYTTFGYSALRIEPKAIPPEETVTVTVDVKNTGKRAGSEVMQCYIQDVISSVTTPSLELKGFQKVSLVPGETKTVRFVLGPDHLSLLDRHLKRVVEPGEFKVMIGHSSKDIRLDGSFNVTLEAIPETTAKIDQKRMPYLDPGRPIDQRVEDLLSRMTLPEKVGQMNIPCTYKKRIGWGLNEKDVSMHTTLSPDVRARQIEGCKKFTAGSLAEGLGPGGGFFTLCDRLVYEGTRKQAELLNELQRIAKAETRLKIPLLQIEEGTHGLMCSGATIFPEGLSLGSTWNLTLVQAVYEAAAREGRAIGVHGLCTLVVESIRDPRLGRNEEAFSECPFLCSQIAESIVRALQGEDIRAADKLAAFLCHYPGQSEPVSGLERGAMHVSTRKLHEVFLPPWVAGIKRCGALGAMATYPAIDGVPVHGSYEILTELLREELGFKGVLLSEGRGISTLIDECMVDNQKEAGQIAAKAGVDVGISMEDAYLSDLITSVREGMVPMQVIDRAVRRILRLKFMLGLFENAAVDVERAVSTVHCQSHRDLALQAAREGIVLLKNENGLLPLQKDIKTIAVIGPNADASRDQLGDYSPFHIITDIVTVLDGIKKKVSPDTRIIHVKGCEIQGIKHNEIDKAKQAAQEADIAVVVVGESRNTDGEGRDVGDLNLTGLQQALVQAVCATGTPTVVVLINGRPLSTVWTAENADAVVEAWNCGERGGEAVADVLFGDYNPSGRLSITIPRHVGQLPVYYNHSPSKKGKVYRNLDAKPLYEFGYGLSYTEFTYSNLTMSSRNIGIADTIQISVDVKNSGQRPGEEVVQLYVNDVLSSVTTPIMDLRAFKKIKLEPDQSKTVRFTLMPEHLMLLDRNLRWTVEPGEFVVMIGHSSQDIRLKDRFNVTR